MLCGNEYDYPSGCIPGGSRTHDCVPGRILEHEGSDGYTRYRARQPQCQAPGYAQDDWVRLHGYINMSWGAIVELWFRYNNLLAALVENIPKERLGRLCFIGANPPVTLRFLIEDYILHMQHHIDQLLHREVVTPYPRAAVFARPVQAS